MRCAPDRHNPFQSIGEREGYIANLRLIFFNSYLIEKVLAPTSAPIEPVGHLPRFRTWRVL